MNRYDFSSLQKLAETADVWVDVAGGDLRGEISFHNTDKKERVSRALSWYRRTGKTDNDDERLIYSLITLNSLYARLQKAKGRNDDADAQAPRKEDYELLKDFVDQLVKYDEDEIILHFLREEQREEFEQIQTNPYLFKGYWHAQPSVKVMQGQQLPRWMEWKRKEDEKAESALSEGAVALPLLTILSRIKSLRNQILHGECGYGDFYNRLQVSACAKFLFPLTGRMIAIVVDSPKKAWGAVPYPPQATPNAGTKFPSALGNDKE